MYALYAQTLANGLMLGALYACIAVGFSLVWGVLNVINMLHGSFIILGGYLAYFAWTHFQVPPFVSIFGVAALLYLLGYLIQYGIGQRPRLGHAARAGHDRHAVCRAAQLAHRTRHRGRAHGP